jgi:hypothetical protein
MSPPSELASDATRGVRIAAGTSYRFLAQGPWSPASNGGRAERVSLVIPAYNEAAAITEVILQAHQALADVADYEIIVVNDGSTDRTGELAQMAGARVIDHPYNRGYGNSLKTGILASRYESIVICDADLSYPLDQLPRLLAEAEHYDMIVGARQGKHFYGSFLKRIARWCQLRLVSFAVGIRVPDANSGLRLIRRSVARRFFPFLCTGFSFTTSLTIALLCEQYLVKFIPVPYHRRRGSSHVRPVRDTLRSLQIIVHCILRYNPLKLFLPLAAVPLVLAASCVIAGMAAPVWLLGAMLSLCASLVILALGMLAYCNRSSSPLRAIDAGVNCWLEQTGPLPPRRSRPRARASHHLAIRTATATRDAG